MKAWFVGAAAAAALMAPGLACADTSGSIDLSLDMNDLDWGPSDEYGLGGAIVHELGNGVTLQADGRSVLRSSRNGDAGLGYAAAHASKTLGNWDVGGFAGIITQFDQAGTLFGVEARTALGDFSVDGSIARFEFSGVPAPDLGFNGTAYRVGGAYFFSPNFSVSVGASETFMETAWDPKYDFLETSLGGAFQFSNNVEIFGGYAYTDVSGNFATDYRVETVSLGVRFNIGGGTLQDNASRGAWSSARHVMDTQARW